MGNQSNQIVEQNKCVHYGKAEYYHLLQLGRHGVSAGQCHIRVDFYCVNSKNHFIKISGVVTIFRKSTIVVYMYAITYEVIASCSISTHSFKRDVKKAVIEFYEDSVPIHKTGKVITLRKPDKNLKKWKRYSRFFKMCILCVEYGLSLEI